MMTYLKHVGGKKHSDLKTKTFEEIQVLYERLKRQDQNFVAIRSAEDERQIKELNKDPEKKRLKKRVVNKTLRKEDISKWYMLNREVTEKGTKKRKSGHVKMIARKRPRPQPDDDSDDEHRKCLRIVTFEGTIDSEIMETKSFIARLHKVSSPDGNYLVVYRVNGHFRAFNYLMEVLHIFDRHDLFHLYDLVMKQYSEITPEDIELILWGDLKIMMDPKQEENDQVRRNSVNPLFHTGKSHSLFNMQFVPSSFANSSSSQAMETNYRQHDEGGSLKKFIPSSSVVWALLAV
ncbi:hypothetical protein Tco_0143684 [Tanacetum coccineum]